MSASGNYNHHKKLEFFKLSRNPFPVAPDNTDFYISQHNDLLITKLSQAILSRKGFMLLTGDIGLGKTTLSRRIIHIIEQQNVETSLILQSFYQETSLLKEIIKDFGIRIEETRNDLSVLMKLLNDFLLKKNKAGINCAIIIDDAQNLSIESLELVRMISNFEADREKLVQILLVGQSELMDKLNCHELRQLKSRVSIMQCPLPLEKSEVGNYIQFKLNKAGDSGKIIVPNQTIQKLCKLTAGNLRRINILMDMALQFAFQESTHILKPKFIARASKELAFDTPGWKSPVAASSFIILMLVLVILGMGTGTAMFFWSSNKRQMPAAAVTDHATAAIDAAAISIPPDFKNPGVNHSVHAKRPLTKDLVSDAVTSFLSGYGLESFSLEFQRGLSQKNLSDIQEIIFHQTGYRLIKIHALPKPVREKFDILTSQDPVTQEKEYYLFWKPWINIVKFYYGYRGEEISELQKLLSSVHLYDYNIDGIVGQRILKSVIVFQRQNNLPVTGFPDPETVFMLANMNR